ncbi:MAG: Plasmid maintenance system killer [Candidatus Woesebacteria bacterium GW2011_GWA2_40_7]|uniref:Plasmid maintenance system killer n=3 Tax=Candidatus Woeseibacteriota TaxID=1752722 RepID=A0A0G0XX19_9BACT|nr:MAG: Plasmid maintenance system killer [Candidatus Woesebacteria bacterium GW2011_GWB1_39_10]KKR74203.1 MAG: Plasmid maintenance system killer [Candidatus Woesebacteria bacterium GW2011_GWA2_40_7]KKR92467.1 MAG: Plasmid maintenance system killer [Candidatus Woesebacteria bacterium GW2011_GWA1_41_13b]
MNIRTTTYFDKNLSKKIRKNPQLKAKVKKQIELLRENFRHPSLRLHKLTGKRAQEYSFWIEGNLRITFVIIGNAILFTDIITHDEY